MKVALSARIPANKVTCRKTGFKAHALSGKAVRAFDLVNFMNFQISRASQALISVACLTAVSAHAQSTDSLSPVVVTATRSPTALTDILADVSVFDRDQIDRSGATAVSEVLSRLPGISISQTGGPGSTTGVFVRGSDSRFTAVYVDGVRIDSQSTGGASWEALPLSQVERIEVLRGPAAAIYGSDAVAGVVQIFTREGVTGFRPSLGGALSSYGTKEANASLRGGDDKIRYALSLAQDQSKGFNAKLTGNPDLDGYRNQSFSGRLVLQLNADQKLDFTALQNDQKSGYDGYTPGLNDQALRKLQTLGLKWSTQWTDKWKTQLGLTKGTDRYETSPSVYLTQTQTTGYSLRNELTMGAGLLALDLERRADELDNSSTTPALTSRHQDALAVGYGRRMGAHSLQVNARHDNDSELGQKSSGGLAYGYAITRTLRVTASTGTAFRVPTLFQRFSVYGSANLKPETSSSHEIGLRWLSGPDRAAVVVYQNTLSNLIDYVSGPGSCVNGVGTYAGCYNNVGHARMSGVTLSANTAVANVHLGASLDVMKPLNLDTHKDLARRARNQVKFTADMPVDDWRLSGELQYVGERFDNASNTTRLAPYALIGISAGKSISHDWRLLTKINNLTDKNYTLANGYSTPGRVFYVGLNWAPQN